MIKKFGLLGLIAILILAGNLYPTLAQDENPYATYQLTMRTGPGTTYGVVTYLDAGTTLILEARDAEIAWVLGRTADGAFRGWVYAIYLTYPPGYAAARLPVSSEVVNAAAPPAADAPQPSEPSNDAPAAAPAGGIGGYASYDLNVRSGPGTNYAAIGIIPGGTGLILEGRNADASWVLAKSADGNLRGWLSALYIRFEGTNAWNLPETGEVVSVPASSNASPATNGSVPSTTGGGYDGIILGSFDPSTVANIDLAAIPAVGQSTPRARDIFLNGRALGRDPHVLAKVGDCSTEHWYFLSPLGWGRYNLGNYSNLQGVVDHFGESLGYNSEAANNGYNVNSVMNPIYANPAVCQPDESPLACEYRLHNASVAVIMFGTSDLIVMSAYEFDFYLRDVVRLTIEANVIPILSTFPSNLQFRSHTILYNQIVVKIAQDYGIPLINLWVALETLPNHGVDDDGFHLDTPPDDNSCHLYGDYMQNGYNVRNLVTLQTLDNVWRDAMR